MTEHDDGGPAFPTVVPPVPTMGLAPGMSLRDWFAGQALAGILASLTPDNSATYAALTGEAFDLADAMLAARKTEPKS